MELEMTIYGYARVSTDGQSLAAQFTELKGAKCEKIFQEKISGARSDRKQLTKLMALTREGRRIGRHSPRSPSAVNARPSQFAGDNRREGGRL
jgi:predicted site-specific integrase-resolvase